MVKIVRNTAIKLLITGGVVVGVIILADRFNLGTRIGEGARAVGQTGGNIITQPIAGLTETLTSGISDIAAQARGLFESLGSAGADVQGAFTGNRNAIGDFFSTDNNQSNPDDRFKPVNIDFNLGAILDNTAKRISQQVQNASNPNTTAFGGFGSAQAQEQALQKAIAESRARFGF